MLGAKIKGDKMSFNILKFIVVVIGLSACIQTDVIDDFVGAKIEITNGVMSLKEGDTYQLEYRYLNEVGAMTTVEVDWTSLSPDLLSIDDNGLLMANMKGESVVTVSSADDSNVNYSITIEVSEETVVIEETDNKKGVIVTSSSYVLTGDFTIENIDGGVFINIADNYVAADGLPGLVLYLSNNPSSNVGAFEVAAVETFSGAHSYEVLADDLTVNTYGYLLYYCKPFSVKVGHGEITE